MIKFQTTWNINPSRRVLIILPYVVPMTMFDLAERGNSVIVACLNPPKDLIKAGKAVSIPSKVFDAQVLIDQLPFDWSPDIVQISARNMAYRPKNLHKFNCPTVLKLGDINHWGNGSLSEMVEYAKALNCDFNWSYQSTQQLHFFLEAGLKNVFWIPATMGMPLPKLSSANKKRFDVVFRGSLNKVHSRRKSYLDFLVSQGVNVDIGHATYQQSLQDYSESIISFNCSGNGDFNRRIFEVMLAGGFLLTDRLTKYTGLFELFEESIHLECYGDEIELLDKVQYYLKYPEKAEAIAIQGHQRIMQCYSPEMSKKIFDDIVTKKKIDPIFFLGHDPRVLLDRQPYDHLVKRMKFYELVQELQAINSHLDVLIIGLENNRMISDLMDLQNVTCNKDNVDFYDLIYISKENDINQIAHKLKPGGLLILDKGINQNWIKNYKRINLVDAITRSILGENTFDIYQVPGVASINICKQRPIDFLNYLIRRIK